MKTLRVLSENKGQTLFIRFVGSIDEDAGLDTVKVDAHQDVIMDMGEVDSINSCGGREWVKWIKKVSPRLRLEFINCSAVFLDYANMIEGFVPANGVIESFNVPYYCEACDQLSLQFFQSSDIQNDNKKIPEAIPCNKCKKNAEIDVIVPIFLRFLKKSNRTSSLT